MKGIQFIPNNTRVNFIGGRMAALVLSSVLIFASLFLTMTRGLNLGVDFTGGTIIEVKVPEQPNLSDLREQLNGLGIGSVSIQEFGAPDDLLIRLPQQDEDTPEAQKAAEDEAQAAVRALLEENFEEAIDYRRTEFVGPQVGEELKKQGAYAVLFSLIGILIYVWIRFEWQFGVAALAALAHDSVLTIGFFALTQMEFNLATVAAILTIAGYSINDTVVVFDRIRENLRKFKKMALGELFNLSVNQTLSRTVMTSVTTLLALMALYLFGGEVLRGFVTALIFGIFVGTYSSIFVAAPLLKFMNIRPTHPPSPEEASA